MPTGRFAFFYSWPKAGLLLVFAVWLALPAQAQQKRPQQKPADKQSLQQKRDQLLADIRQTRQELERIRNQKSTNLAELNALQQQIATREQIISIYNQQLQQANREIFGTGKQIEDLQAELVYLKESYARMVRLAYKNRFGYGPYVFLLSSNSFNQAWVRLRHLQRLTAWRHQRANEIVQARAQLQQKRVQLQAGLAEKKSLLNNEKLQRTELQGDASQRSKLIRTLSQNEEQLQQQLAEKRAAADRLQNAIEEVLRRETRTASSSGKRNETRYTDLTKTPEAEKLSGEFGGNKGRLPWPVAEGAVAETFGNHPHPVLKGVTVKNDGINIRTRPGSDVHCLFRGEVTGIVNVPGMQRAVIVRHGQYLSVYAHLESVHVAMGQKLSQGQEIGSVYTDLEEHRTELHLEVWKGMEKTNPMGWLKRK